MRISTLLLLFLTIIYLVYTYFNLDFIFLNFRYIITENYILFIFAVIAWSAVILWMILVFKEIAYGYYQHQAAKGFFIVYALILIYTILIDIRFLIWLLILPAQLGILLSYYSARVMAERGLLKRIFGEKEIVERIDCCIYLLSLFAILIYNLMKELCTVTMGNDFSTFFLLLNIMWLFIVFIRIRSMIGEAVSDVSDIAIYTVLWKYPIIALGIAVGVVFVVPKVYPLYAISNTLLSIATYLDYMRSQK